MDPDQLQELIDTKIGVLAKRLDAVDAYIAESQKERQVMSSLIARLTVVLAGDGTFKQKGLVDTVGEHEKFIRDMESMQQQFMGGMRSFMWIGGAVVTLLNLGGQFLLWWLKNG